jgi:hypothetical protein
MLSLFWKFVFVALIAPSVSLPVMAEQPARSPAGETIPTGSPFSHHPRPLTLSSGYIFAGTVKSVEHAAPKGNGFATVQINFHVDQGMRGVRTGQTVSIREWAGLWQSGERYRPGERVLLFLYPPSQLGLTSPVRGPAGRFRIGPDGRVIVDPGRTGLLSPGPSMGDGLRGRSRVTPVEFVRFLRSAEEE